MATHSSTLAWEIPCTEEPGGLQSMGSQSQTRLKRLNTAQHLVVFSLSMGDSACYPDKRAWHAAVHGVAKSST